MIAFICRGCGSILIITDPAAETDVPCSGCECRVAVPPDALCGDDVSGLFEELRRRAPTDRDAPA